MENNVPTKPEWNGWCDYTYGKIQLSVEDWCHCLRNPNIFKDRDIELIEKIRRAPDEAYTCKALAEEEGKHPSAYNSPVANLGMRVSDEMDLPALENENGGERFWAIIFLGKYVDGDLFSWKVRPELSEAMKELEPE